MYKMLDMANPQKTDSLEEKREDPWGDPLSSFRCLAVGWNPASLQ
jgi:hypothetical protein